MNLDVNYIISKYWNIKEDFVFLQNTENIVYISDNYVARFSMKNPRKELLVIEELNSELTFISSLNGEKAVFKDKYYCTLFNRVKGKMLMEEKFSTKLAEPIAEQLVYMHKNLEDLGEHFPELCDLEHIKNRNQLWENKYSILETYFNQYKNFKRDCLIHGDLHLKNIMRTEDNNFVILDYDDLRWGTIEEEISIHLFYIKYLSVAIYNNPKLYLSYKKAFVNKVKKSIEVKEERLNFYEEFRHIENYLWLKHRYNNIPEGKIIFYNAVKSYLDNLITIVTN